MSKTPEDALDLFEEMANTQSLWSNERTITKKAGAIEVDSLTMLNAKLDALTKRTDKVNVNAISTLSSSCELCQGGHPTIECQMMQGMTIEGVNSWATSKDPRTKSMEILTIQVRGIIQISLGAIKKINSGDHKHSQDLEVKMHNNLNLNFTKSKVHPLELQWRARWRNSWI